MSVQRDLARRVRLENSRPRFEPCLPRPAKQPPAGPDWIHEIKHDGFRIVAYRDGIGARLITRNGFDFAKRFPLVPEAIVALPARSCVIDGEAIACDESGLAVFDLIRYRRQDHAVTLCAFDLLELDGDDLRRRSIEERKRALKRLLRRKHPGHCLQPVFRRGGRYCLQERLRAWLRGYRVETARFALSLWARRSLAKDQEPRGAGCEAGG